MRKHFMLELNYSFLMKTKFQVSIKHNSNVKCVLLDKINTLIKPVKKNYSDIVVGQQKNIQFLNLVFVVATCK